MSDIISSLPEFLSDFAADLAALEHEAYEASVLLSEKEQAIADAQAAREEQIAVARAVAKALRHEFPGVGQLLTLPTSQPADPLAAKAWRAAWKARAIIQKAGEAKIAEARERGDAAIKRLLSISEYYRVDADRVRPFQSLAEALAVIDAKPQGRRAAAPTVKRAAKPSTKHRHKPVAKKDKKQRGGGSDDILAAVKAWKALGGSALKQRNGEWMFTLADPVLIKIRVRSQSDVENVIAAVRAAQKAAQTGGNPKAALVAALAL